MKTAIPAALALALLCGCEGPSSARAPQDSNKFTVENTMRFVALDAATDAAVSCTGLQELTLPDGRLEVVANLRNSDPGPVSVEVECVFLDDQGAQTGPAARWMPAVIAGGATQVARFKAPGPAARKYSIRVRRAR